MSVKIVGEIGINHNGDISLAKKLIDLCYVAGVDYVKFQKRDPEISTPDHQKNVEKDTPWGKIKYIEYKHKIEFGKEEYDEIDSYCKAKQIKWFASVWDENSAEFMAQYSEIVKVPSACITDLSLLEKCRKLFNRVIMSSGMSTEEEIEKAVSIGKPSVILHCNASYPANVEELNLDYIRWLLNKYPMQEIGYSGHEFGLVTTFSTIPMGVTWIERHITLDRRMWGSDHLSSVEPEGLFKLVRGIRDIERARGKVGCRKVLPSEESKRKSLRRFQ